MAHISLREEDPGIVGLLRFRPETGKVLLELAEVLLRGESTLSPGERELIAGYVSSQNDCRYCAGIHTATARHLLASSPGFMDAVLSDHTTAPISAKLKALLVIAGKVRQGGHFVTDEDVAQAREHGATDIEIHDTVLIAAAFCMFNRYVDGLATAIPPDEAYEEWGKEMAARGYI